MKPTVLAAAVVLLATPVWAQPAQQATAMPTFNTSAVVTTGNAFQTILPAVNAASSVTRRSLTIQNNNATDSCWIFVGSGAAAKATSILLTAGQGYTRYFPYVPSDAVQATCATAGDTLYVDTQ